LSSFVPTRIFLTKGVGIANEQLTSFEMSLRNAGISQFNLVNVSSIFPPGCKMVTREQGLKELRPGQIVYVVMSRNATNEPYRQMAASVGLAMPKDKSHYGYISEHHSYGETDQKAGDYAEDLAATMLATILGVDFDPDKSYDERKETWKISGQIYRTMNITETARGNTRGKWTTVVSAAVLLP